MSETCLRFVHASDFQLDVPLAGIAQIPPHLLDLLVDAPLQAAANVFQAVLDQEADFLVLAGDLVSADRCGPREVLFLVEQFEKLAQRQIPVYWMTGPHDPDRHWTAASLLPDNVVRLWPDDAPPQGDPRPGASPVRIVNEASLAAGTTAEATAADQLISIGISRSVPDPELLDQHAVAYWALGGSAGRRTVSRQPTAVHDSGSPQGRGPAATGPHGCTLVEISTAHTATLTPLTTDVVRWHAEKVEIDPGVDAIQLELQLRQRLQQLLTSHADPSVQVVLVQLAIGGQGPVLGALQQQGVAQQMTAKLCAEFGQQTPALWTISLDAEPRHDFPPAWYEEETMRGEFLRNVRALESARKRKIDLSTYLERLPADLAAALDIPDAATRAEVLQRAATLGGEMLSGHGT